MKDAAFHGGNVILGWTVWEVPDAYFVCEYHAVVERDGAYMDTTPQPCGASRILFSPVPGATIPENASSSAWQPRSKLLNLSGSPLVDDYFAYAMESNEHAAETVAWFRAQNQAAECLERFFARKEINRARESKRNSRALNRRRRKSARAAR
jgi:hypothetical protein